MYLRVMAHGFWNSRYIWHISDCHQYIYTRIDGSYMGKYRTRGERERYLYLKLACELKINVHKVKQHER